MGGGLRVTCVSGPSTGSPTIVEGGRQGGKEGMTRRRAVRVRGGRACAERQLRPRLGR